MLRKYALYLSAGLGILFAAMTAGYLLRPLTLNDDGKTTQIHAGSVTVGQALSAAGVSLDPQDQVQPALDHLIPLDGQIHIRRAVQATVWEDGKLRHISGLEKKLSVFLSQANIQVGADDQILWDGQPLEQDTQLPTDRPIVLQLIRGRTLVLDQNGQRKTFTSAAPTAARALWDAGVRVGPADALSIPADSLLAENTVIGYQSARQLVVQVDGQNIQAHSTAPTIGQALAEAGVTLQGMDYTQPADNQPLPQDGQIRVVRVSEEIALKETLLPFERTTTNDPNVELDQRKVTQAGQYGVKVQRERARFEDGKEVSRGPDSDWVASAPVAQTVGIGTKVVPKSMDTPDGKIEYWREIRVYATSYSPCTQGYDHCSWSTASGMRLTKGVVGVSLRWFRMMQGQRVYIPGYGLGVIGDYGGVSGMWIDLGFDEENFKDQAIVGWVTMYFLTPVPTNIPWTLP